MLPDLIVVTDLDATLLDHFDYSFTAAAPALKRLRALRIPLILNSSKTQDEMLVIREKLQLSYPFIVENGAGVIIPEGGNLQSTSLGMNRAEILSVIHELREKHGFSFTGFADMKPEQVTDLTGLSLGAARLALQRKFTETLVWQDSTEQFESFTAKLKQAGLSLIRGGRFWHVSADADKGKAITWLKNYYRDQSQAAPQVIALGDSENDLPMLQVADYPVLVKSPVKDFPEFTHKALRKTEDYGPQGWNQAVLEILEDLKNND